jgi:hypothetical protein
LSTLCAALDNNYVNGFGITKKMVMKYHPTSAPMIKGHLDQSRQNQRSTKVTDETNEDYFPSAMATGLKIHFCYAAITSTGKIFTDQTGRFILPSSTGNTQLMEVYDYDSNYIHAEPMKSKTGPAILELRHTNESTKNSVQQACVHDCNASTINVLRNLNHSWTTRTSIFS